MSPRVRRTSHRYLPARSSVKILLSMASPPVRKRSTSMNGYFFCNASTTCLLWLKVIVVQWTKRFSFFAPSIKFESKSLWGQAAENKPENKMTKKDRANVFIEFLPSFDSHLPATQVQLINCRSSVGGARFTVQRSSRGSLFQRNCHRPFVYGSSLTFSR